jgi:hypothetical protein
MEDETVEEQETPMKDERGSMRFIGNLFAPQTSNKPERGIMGILDDVGCNMAIVVANIISRIPWIN